MKKTDLPQEENTDLKPPEGPITSRTIKKLKMVFGILVFLYVSLILLALEFSYRPVTYPGKKYCSRVEQDAKSTLAAIALHFSDPGNMRMPEVSVLVSDANLILNNPQANVSLSPRPGVAITNQEIRVTIFDDSNSCPRGSILTATMGSSFYVWE